MNGYCISLENSKIITPFIKIVRFINWCVLYDFEGAFSLLLAPLAYAILEILFTGLRSCRQLSL